MKRSVRSIFNNLRIYLLSLFFVAFVAMILIFEQKLSFEKVNILNEQKNLITILTKLPKNDLEINLNSKSTHLIFKIQTLHTMNNYNFTDKLFFGNTQEYEKDLTKLSELTHSFNKAAQEFYSTTFIRNEDIEKIINENFNTAFTQINSHINEMLLRNITYDQQRFNIAEFAIVISFILILLATFWYRKRLDLIYKDIEYLYQIERNKMAYTIFSIEADAISLRMNRKTVNTDNPSMLDPITEINNYKGMVNAYSQKKGLKNSNFTSVTVLEIDNFSKSKRAFSQEVTQAILKKVAYTLSLHEQPLDVIARTDYNQFTLIFSRPSKEQSFKDVELVRQSISELKFNFAELETSNITVSGGFIIKPNNTNLEEAIRQAKEILLYAKKVGSNRVLQTRDIAEKEM